MRIRPSIIRCLWFLACLCFAGGAVTQTDVHLRFEQFTEDDGLGNDMVYRVFEHPGTGYLWFGTGLGLVRFNGKKFVQHPGAFPFRTSVIALCEANEEDLLVGSYRQGIYRQNARTPHQSEPVDSNLNKAIKIRSLSDGRIVYLGSSSYALVTLTREGRYDTTQSFKTYVTDFLVNDSGLSFIATHDGLYHYPSSSAAPEKIYEGLVTWILPDEGHILFAAENRIFRYENGTVTLHMSFPELGTIERFIKDRHGNTWLGMLSRGFYMVHGDEVIDAGAKLKNKNLLVQDLHEDRAGNIWITTRINGVYKINSVPGVQTFRGLGTESLYLRTGDELANGAMLIGGDNELFICYQDSCSTVSIKRETDWLYIYDVMALEEDAIVNTSQGVYRYEVETGEMKLLDRHSCPKGLVTDDGSIYVTHEQELYQLTANGLEERLSLETTIQAIHLTEKGILIFSKAGVYEYEPARNFTQLITNKGPSIINNVLVDQDGAFWCATRNGLYRYAANEWMRIPQKEPGSATHFLSLTMDDQGDIWVTASHGLKRVQNRAGSQPYLSSAVVLTEALTFVDHTRDGGLVMAGREFLFRLNEKPETIEDVQPQLLPISLVAGGDTISDALYPSAFEIEHRSDLVVNFDVVDLTGSSDMGVTYELLNAESKPRLIGGRKLVVSGLAPGKHQLELRVVNAARDGTGRKLIEFEVTAPWWMQPLGATVLILALLFLIFGFTGFISLFQRRVYKRRLDAEVLKMRALNNQLNPHFLSNALNSIKHLLQTADQAVVTDYINQFNYLLRKNLARLEQNTITIEEEVKLLQAYLELEQLRFEHKFEFEVFVDDQIHHHVRIPFMIVQPYVENALWHGLLASEDREKRLKVSFLKAEEKGRITIRIEDNGRGMVARQTKRVGHHDRLSGMKITEQRLKLMDKTARIQISTRTTHRDQHERGTVVSLSFRIMKVTLESKINAT